MNFSRRRNVAKFLTELDIKCVNDDLWELDSPLIYESDILERTVSMPKGFRTDLASVPRIPLVYMAWGGRAHREAVLHDYLYRIDSDPVVSFSIANAVFYEAMKAREKPFYVRYPMFWGVCLGGITSYHKRKV
jgi:hypothetical protein